MIQQHFLLALDKQAVTPGPLPKGSHHLNDAAVEDDSLSDYYTDDENEIDDILSKQEEEAYNVLPSLSLLIKNKQFSKQSTKLYHSIVQSFLEIFWN